MASHQLAIAKASFSAGLLRPDPTSLSREGIAQFHTLLNSAVIQCTPKNVQNCKNWILENIIQSTARFTALGKYITALATSFAENGGFLDPTSRREPSIKRKRLHLLYLVNDLLHHAKFRINDASICGKLQPILMSLVGSTASFKGCPKHQQKILDLLSLWEEKGYYSNDYVDKLREAVKNASELGVYSDGPSASGDQDLLTKVPKLTPFVMPAMHGDASTPWFDLPAGNLMPHIIPNSTRPINPDMIKPLQFVAGPADEGLVIAVKGLLDDVQKIFGGEIDQDEKVIWDIDELGQPIILDEVTGDVLEGEGYYGWSRTFCEKMKRRRKGLDMPGEDENRGRRSRSGSSTPNMKRRRYSPSDDGSSPIDRRPPQQRRYSSSRSPSRSPLPRMGRSRTRSRDRSYSPRRSPSPRRDSHIPLPPPQERQQNVPQKPPGNFNQPRFSQNEFDGNGLPPPPPPPPQNMPYGTPQNVPYPIHPNAPLGMSPQNPPYNMPYNGSNQQQHGSWGPPQPSFAPWPPPPPPPPPGPPFQQQQQQPPPPPGGYPPNGPGGWQQPQQPGAGGWQPPNQPNNGRGFSNNSWNNGSPGRGGRGNYRGRGW